MYVGPCAGYCKHPNSFQSVLLQGQIMKWLFQYYKNMYRNGRTDLNKPPFWGQLSENNGKMQAYVPSEWGHRVWNPTDAGYHPNYPKNCNIFMQTENCCYTIVDADFVRGNILSWNFRKICLLLRNLLKFFWLPSTFITTSTASLNDRTSFTYYMLRLMLMLTMIERTMLRHLFMLIDERCSVPWTCNLLFRRKKSSAYGLWFMAKNYRISALQR